MLKTITLALVVTTIGAGAVAAQDRGAATEARQDDRLQIEFEQELQSSLQARMAARAALTGDRTDASATSVLAPPADWTEGDQAWRDHMRRCVTRYQTYDPATDLYLASPGVQKRCTP